MTSTRGGIHLYYCWTALTVVPWMIGALVIYRELGSIWPLVIGHVAYDLLVFLNNRLPQFGNAIAIMLWVTLGTGIAITIVSVARQRRRGPNQLPDTEAIEQHNALPGTAE